MSESKIIEVPTDPKVIPNEDSAIAVPSQPEAPGKEEKPVQPEGTGKEGTPTAPVEEKPKEDKPSVPEVPEYTDPVGTSSTDGEGNLITPQLLRFQNSMEEQWQ